MTWRVRGVGVDTVDLGAFAVSLDEPGTRMLDAFSATERRQCRERAEARGAAESGGMVGAGGGMVRAGGGMVRHLAARWAAKEAVLKAWSAALYGQPPAIPPDLVRWPEIETVCDAWGRPAVRLTGEVARQVAATVGETTWHVSLSHDGDAAVAYVVLSSERSAP